VDPAQRRISARRKTGPVSWRPGARLRRRRDRHVDLQLTGELDDVFLTLTVTRAKRKNGRPAAAGEGAALMPRARDLHGGTRTADHQSPHRMGFCRCTGKRQRPGNVRSGMIMFVAIHRSCSCSSFVSVPVRSRFRRQYVFPCRDLRQTCIRRRHTLGLARTCSWIMTFPPPDVVIRGPDAAPSRLAQPLHRVIMLTVVLSVPAGARFRVPAWGICPVGSSSPSLDLAFIAFWSERGGAQSGFIWLFPCVPSSALCRWRRCRLAATFGATSDLRLAAAARPLT